MKAEQHFHNQILVGSSEYLSESENGDTRTQTFRCACGSLVEKTIQTVSRHTNGMPLQQRITYAEVPEHDSWCATPGCCHSLADLNRHAMPTF